ncbi:MAG: hypothetical protein PVG41_07060, partial [Desulfobacteraceae bacterium]
GVNYSGDITPTIVLNHFLFYRVPGTCFYEKPSEQAGNRNQKRKDNTTDHVTGRNCWSLLPIVIYNEYKTYFPENHNK